MPNRDRDLGYRIEELQRRAAQLGRDPVPVSYFGAEPTRSAVARSKPQLRLFNWLRAKANSASCLRSATARK